MAQRTKKTTARGAQAIKSGTRSKPETTPANAPSARDVTREGEARRRLAERARQKRIDEYDAEVKGVIAVKAPRALGARGVATDQRPALRIIAEGDSWFDYPLEGKPFRSGDVIQRLRDLIPYPILNLALRGDESRYMLGVEERPLLRRLLEDPGRDFNVILFSGGGNDIVGNAFRLWLRDRDTAGGDPFRALNDAAFGSILNVVRVAYEDLLDLRDGVAARTANRTITVFVHEYDWAIPDGRGVCGFGPWLRNSLIDRGWSDPDEARAVVKEALTRFAILLQDISRQYNDVIVVRTQGTLGDNEWHNELHPNRRGFPKIAARFRDALKARFPQLLP